MSDEPQKKWKAAMVVTPFAKDEPKTPELRYRTEFTNRWKAVTEFAKRT
ncbi:MAG: hypothetical protein IJG38_01590 [Thermoguttaceae bacterium]|nr:hypothetical protein [Thermoguttaceae bacterium]